MYVDLILCLEASLNLLIWKRLLTWANKIVKQNRQNLTLRHSLTLTYHRIEKTATNEMKKRWTVKEVSIDRQLERISKICSPCKGVLDTTLRQIIEPLHVPEKIASFIKQGMDSKTTLKIQKSITFLLKTSFWISVISIVVLNWFFLHRTQQKWAFIPLSTLIEQIIANSFRYKTSISKTFVHGYAA